MTVSLKVSNNGETETSDTEYEEFKKSSTSIKREINRCKKYNQKILDFPFERYFANEMGIAKIDLLTAWLLGYKEKTFSRIMMAHQMEFRNANTFMKRYNERKKKQFELPSSLPNNTKFQEFQKELGKLPLATRLHLFDVYEYSGFLKKPAKKPLSEMTMYDTRAVGIDENELADILRQSKLITNFPEGGGVISPEYVGAVSIVLDYAKKLEPVYYEWKSEIRELISNKTSVYVYDKDNPSNDEYYEAEE